MTKTLLSKTFPRAVRPNRSAVNFAGHSIPDRLTVSLEFKLADVWIGAFFNRKQLSENWDIERVNPHEDRNYIQRLTSRTFVTEVWVCLLPCLPIHFRHEKTFPEPEPQEVKPFP